MCMFFYSYIIQQSAKQVKFQMRFLFLAFGASDFSEYMLLKKSKVNQKAVDFAKQKKSGIIYCTILFL